MLTGSADVPVVVTVTGAKLPESRDALQIVRDSRTYLPERWTELHG